METGGRPVVGGLAVQWEAALWRKATPQREAALSSSGRQWETARVPSVGAQSGVCKDNVVRAINAPWRRETVCGGRALLSAGQW